MAEHLLKVRPTLIYGEERFPVIVSETGMPEFYPNTFLSGTLRREGMQFNTLLTAANALKPLRAWELLSGIDLVDRMTTGKFLKPHEAESLADAMWQGYGSLRIELQERAARNSRSSGKVADLADYRRRRDRLKECADIKSGTVASRMGYVVRYLKHLGLYAVYAEEDLVVKALLKEELKDMCRMIAVRAPDAWGGNMDIEYERLGLTYQTEAILREAIEPGHKANPWSEKTQLRNSMTVKLLLGIGIRGGEFLNLRIPDIDLRQNVIYIRRLPDNPDDPRLHEPNVKTLPRRLRIKDPLAELIQQYIINDRRKYLRKYRCARKEDHDFLAVSCDDGSPLSRTAYNNIFTAVRDRVPGIPIDFAGHICRITWNDRFTDYCDQRGIDEERERRIRCRIMGWVPGSRMAFYYTKRSTQEAADRCLLESQEVISSGRLGGLFDELTTEDIAGE